MEIRSCYVNSNDFYRIAEEIQCEQGIAWGSEAGRESFESRSQKRCFPIHEFGWRDWDFGKSSSFLRKLSIISMERNKESVEDGKLGFQSHFKWRSSATRSQKPPPLLSFLLPRVELRICNWDLELLKILQKPNSSTFFVLPVSSSLASSIIWSERKVQFQTELWNCLWSHCFKLTSPWFADSHLSIIWFSLPSLQYGRSPQLPWGWCYPYFTLWKVNTSTFSLVKTPR